MSTQRRVIQAFSYSSEWHKTHGRSKQNGAGLPHTQTPTSSTALGPAPATARSAAARPPGPRHRADTASNAAARAVAAEAPAPRHRHSGSARPGTVWCKVLVW